jgi:uncharacterized protein (DUF433 family)
MTNPFPALLTRTAPDHEPRVDRHRSRVVDVLSLIGDGMPDAEILALLPGLERRDLRAAEFYAECMARGVAR